MIPSNSSNQLHLYPWPYHSCELHMRCCCLNSPTPSILYHFVSSYSSYFRQFFASSFCHIRFPLPCDWSPELLSRVGGAIASCHILSIYRRKNVTGSHDQNTSTRQNKDGESAKRTEPQHTPKDRRTRWPEGIRWYWHSVGIPLIPFRNV